MILLNETKFFKSELCVQSFDFLMMPTFVYITISGLMFVASMKTYKLKLLYTLNEEADSQKHLLSY